MNALEQILQDDLHHLVDRIAAAIREGTASASVARGAELASRLGEAESRTAHKGTARPIMVEKLRLRKPVA